MTVNEINEFESINQKVKERTESVEEIQQTVADTYREVKARRKAKAIVSIIAIVLALCVCCAGFCGLEKIGWINTTFRIVLVCQAGAVAMFKVGYFWHEIKS